jgi:hypothetical protein
MQTWLNIDEFRRLSNLSEDRIFTLIDEDKLNSKFENNQTYIEVNSSAREVIPKNATDIVSRDDKLSGADFIEKTIGTILSLHETVIHSKDETLDVLRNENQFLKDALYQMQELYEEERKTIETLREQLRFSQDELESIKRKYRLMWGRAVETGNKLNEQK